MGEPKPELAKVLDVLDTWIDANGAITEMDLNYETGRGAKVRITIRQSATRTGGPDGR